jgi:DNA-directed RNA polymerase subunit M/transcription elongation factor TFIIS
MVIFGMQIHIPMEHLAPGLSDFCWYNIPKRRKNIKWTEKFTKRPQNKPTSSTARTSKIYPNWDFWSENKPSGNPDCVTQSQSADLVAENGETESHSKKKMKRMRTTFTEEQIQILQANFQIDSNPDGQDLERIAQVRTRGANVMMTIFCNFHQFSSKILVFVVHKTIVFSIFGIK